MTKKFNLIRLRNDDFHETCAFLLAIMAVVVLTPFAIIDAFIGDYLLSVSISIFILVFTFIAWKIRNGQYNATYTLAVVLPGITAILLLAFHYLGFMGALWVYPSIIVFYMVLSEKMAWFANAVLLIIISGEALIYLDSDLSIRIIITLIVVSIFIAVFVDIIMQQQEKLRTLVKVDPLTGLLNRSSLSQELQRLIAESERTHNPIAMIQSDLDFFKNVNDSYGHVTGDESLQSFATLMLKRTRKTDDVFRLGGEEFMILLPNTNMDGAITLAEKLRQAVANDPDIKTTASFGVSIRDRGETADSWMIRTDKLLYQAKETGRNRVVN